MEKHYVELKPEEIQTVIVAYNKLKLNQHLITKKGLKGLYWVFCVFCIKLVFFDFSTVLFLLDTLIKNSICQITFNSLLSLSNHTHEFILDIKAHTK